MSSAHSPHADLVGSLYRDHRGWLLAWLQRSMACRQRAEDLSQDTFVRLLGREQLDTPREPRAFLAAVAKGLMFDHFRRAALEQAYLSELARPRVRKVCAFLLELLAAIPSVVYGFWGVEFLAKQGLAPLFDALGLPNVAAGQGILAILVSIFGRQRIVVDHGELQNDTIFVDVPERTTFKRRIEPQDRRT